MKLYLRSALRKMMSLKKELKGELFTARDDCIKDLQLEDKQSKQLLHTGLKREMQADLEKLLQEALQSQLRPLKLTVQNQQHAILEQGSLHMQ